ncbi:hypothetical protein ACTXT7_000335 [Hymenolepis weldensis]
MNADTGGVKNINRVVDQKERTMVERSGAQTLDGKGMHVQFLRVPDEKKKLMEIEMEETNVGHYKNVDEMEMLDVSASGQEPPSVNSFASNQLRMLTDNLVKRYES